MPTFRRREFLAAAGAAVAARGLRAQDAAPHASADGALAADIVAANHILYAKQIVDGFGHVSARTASGAQHFLLSRSLPPAQVMAGDVIEYGLDGNPANGDKRSGYLERFIHCEVYRARPDVMSVVHCHAPSLIPFGITREPLHPVFHNSSFVGEGVPVFEIREAAGLDTDMLIRTPELGKALAATLADKPAVLMRGHGAVIVGRSVEEAVARSVYLELNARIQAQAMAMGDRITYLSDGEVKTRSGAGEYTRAWELWKSEVK